MQQGARKIIIDNIRKDLLGIKLRNNFKFALDLISGPVLIYKSRHEPLNCFNNRHEQHQKRY